MPTTEEINNCDKIKEHMQLSENLLPPHRHHLKESSSKDDKNKAHEKFNLFQTNRDDSNTSYYDFKTYLEYRKSDLSKDNLYPNLNLQRHVENEDKIYNKE